jgi:hypothetical protein
VETIGLLGFSALVLTSFAVAYRLLRLGARTHQLPELMIGGAFVFAGGVPGVLIVAAAGGSATGPQAHDGLLAAMNVSLLLGASMLATFTWRVFRPTEPWARMLFACIVAGLAVGHLGGALAAFEPGSRLGPAFTWTGIGFRVAAYTWACCEATREYAAARRRCALGLADPLVANRMLLWAVGIGAVLAIWIHEGVTLVTGRGPASFLVVALLGFVCSGALSFAFFPPASYRRRFAAAGGA